ncbi:MAG: LamG-like jellyroll fold domain-containing protein, partial [Thermoplasmata archaeon]
MTFYINGVQSGSSTSVTVKPSTSVAPLAVGRRHESATQPWNGNLDEVRVFNSALAAADVQALAAITYRQYSRVLTTYDDSTRRATYEDEDNRRVRATFDSLGRRTKVERLDAAGAVYSVETFAYNWQDLLVIYTSPTSNVTRWTYDVLGRVTREENSASQGTTILYVDENLYQRVTDANGNARAYYRDFAGRLVKVEELGPSVATTRYAYDEVGNLVSVTNALNQITDHHYDDLDRLTWTVYPDLRGETFAYYDSGALKWKWDRDNTVTWFYYDDLDRLTVTDHPGTADDVTYAYDSNGNVLWVNNSVAQVGYTYDVRNRPITERVKFLGTGAPDVTTTYAYSKAGDVTSLAYPGTAFTLSY